MTVASAERTHRRFAAGMRVARLPVNAPLAAAGLLLGLLLGGCGQMPRFPAHPVQTDSQRLAFDLDHDGNEDYWQDVGRDGRKTTLHFDDDGDGRPDAAVRLDAPPPDDVLHVLIVLDGVPFEVIRDLYAEGRFRLFPPPSRLISVFPALTDLALARAFDAGPCLGYEALHYDISRNRLSNGNDVYLSGRNEPWTAGVDYRCSTNWDVLAYLDPSAVWRHEMDRFLHTIRAADSGRVCLYTVATAGLGTRGGRQAIRQYLATIDDLCEQITHERRGQVRFTLFADHGHGLTACKRVIFKPLLREAGFRVTDTIRQDSDVVIPAYGLVTSAVMHTLQPDKVADAILQHEATDLVMYRRVRFTDQPLSWASQTNSDDPDAAFVVRSRDAEAHIRMFGGGVLYEPLTGDPLKLVPVLLRLATEGKTASKGPVADRDWFEATVDHEYPDALYRIRCALEKGTLVENPADLIVSLKEGYAFGSAFFSAICRVESTHGALSRGSSTTFIMSNAVPLPQNLRVDDVPGLLGLDAPD
ncbi:MAG TPA: hypothetical protein VM243_19030 [Phycisphaerae bacterium]|nr:hypothetical protein [Phycisphaerae bacterium]